VVDSRKDAIKRIKEYKPDIAVVNTYIMGVDSLEAATRLRDYNEQMRIILVSEYDYSEFSREDIVLHVGNCVLTPAISTVLFKAIEQCVSELDREELNRIEVQTAKKDCKAVQEQIEYSFMYSIIYNTIRQSEMKKYKDLLRITDLGSIINIEILNEDGRKRKRRLSSELVYRTLREDIGMMYSFVIGPIINDRIILYYSVEEVVSKEDEEKRNSEFANTVKDIIEAKLGVTVQVGIGSTHSIDNIYISYKESIRNLRLRQQETIRWNSKSDKRNAVNKLQLLEKQYLDSVKLDDNNSVKYLALLMKELEEYEEDIKRSKIIELMVLTRYLLPSLNSEDYCLISFMNYCKQISSIRQEELDNWAIKTFEYLQSTQISKLKSFSKIVNEAIVIMKEDFSKDITLKSVANRVGVTSQYLSKIFKEETNFNFMEWLTDYRIERAKEIIQQQNVPIKEVGLSVGYKDPNYFSRTFRNVVGKSPSEYIDDIKKQKKQNKERKE
jgi:two-component system response regulator YesN